jgi:zinc transport system substrate-binding protein
MKEKFTARRLLALTVLLAVLVGSILLATHRTKPLETDPNKLQVAASFYPLYDFAKHVGGDKIQVTNMTPAGAEPHDYEPAPQLLARTQKTPVFIYNGGHLEPWTAGFLTDYKHTAVKASQGIDLMTADDEDDPDKTVQDPHFWLDPVFARQIVVNISDGLSEADPANARYYAQNAETYLRRLDQLDQAFRHGLANCQLRTVISSHDAFSYLGKRYGLEIISIAGLSPDEEPSAASLAQVSQTVREQEIKYVFFESLVSPRLADTIAAETGAKTLVFDPIEGLTAAAQKQGKEYISVQQENLANLRTALACQ